MKMKRTKQLQSPCVKKADPFPKTLVKTRSSVGHTFWQRIVYWQVWIKSVSLILRITDSKYYLTDHTQVSLQNTKSRAYYTYKNERNFTAFQIQAPDLGCPEKSPCIHTAVVFLYFKQHSASLSMATLLRDRTESQSRVNLKLLFERQIFIQALQVAIFLGYLHVTLKTVTVN